MAFRVNLSRCCLLGAALAVSAGFGGKALASDPLPGDLVTPPLNVNIAMFYNEYSNADEFGGQLGDAHGPNAKDSTRISTDIVVARYVRTFSIGPYEGGAQVYLPYVAFLGTQEIGVNDLGSKAPGLLPPLGPGSANLSHNSGFAQPNFSAFVYPIDNPVTGTYAVISPWIAPPVSSFNKNDNLNPNQNVWTYDMELGFRTVLFGTPTTQNLSIEVWNTAYLYGQNTHSSLGTPAISADNIPLIYQELFHLQNPVQAASGTPATFREQPTDEIRVYLPYQFAPYMRAFVAPGFYQSFGGKQTYKLGNGAVIDSGNRTEESQLRLVVSSFISPTTEVLFVGDYDVAAHGAPFNRTIELRLLRFF